MSRPWLELTEGQTSLLAHCKIRHRYTEPHGNPQNCSLERFKLKDRPVGAKLKEGSEESNWLTIRCLFSREISAWITVTTRILTFLVWDPYLLSLSTGILGGGYSINIHHNLPQIDEVSIAMEDYHRPSIPTSDSIHFCPALALHPGLHLTGADHRLDSLAFFRALPQPFRTWTISDLSLMNWSCCRGPGWQRRPGRWVGFFPPKTRRTSSLR